VSKRRSHPPTLIRRAEREIREGGLIGGGMRVLAGVSGGPDSMAMLHVLSVLRAKLGFELFAHAVDHGLRAEAMEEVALAEEQARLLGVPFGVSRLRVEPGGNLQARARAARLGALREQARLLGAVRIALAHHADDRAETVLQRILRGSGPAGLAVLAPRAGDLIRPFVRARRSDVIDHLQRHGIPFAQDPSNEDRRFLRARVRADLLPMLESLSPRIVEHLCSLADDLGALDLPTSPLGRAQLRELGRAASQRRSGIRVSVPGGRVATVDVCTGRIVVEAPEDAKGARKPRQRPDDA
jgi:tRNA(Ile)-lysidine synthase